MGERTRGIPQRILYGVQGEGRGHAGRSLQIIQWLVSKGYRVKVLTGGDAMQVLAGHGLDLEVIPMIRYRFNSAGALDPWRTVTCNALRTLGLLFGIGRQHGHVASLASSFRPHLIISDFEPYLSRLARRMDVPLLAIDHQHFLTESRLPPIKGWERALMLKLYQFGINVWAGRPDGIIASSFYHFPKKPNSRAVFVGPFIPRGLKGLPRESDDSVTVYLKQAGYLSSLLETMAKRPDRRFIVFSDWHASPPAGLPPNVMAAPISREGFLTQLAKSAALITTAGNQVIGEAVFLHKPVLAFPEPDVLEQELNALALNRSGFGETFRLGEFTLARWEAFESGLGRFRTSMEGRFRGQRAFDGRKQALRTLDRFLSRITAGGKHSGKPRAAFAP
jgi:uncharacterized protein (TIGR00661 family)